MSTSMAIGRVAVMILVFVALYVGYHIATKKVNDKRDDEGD